MSVFKVTQTTVKEFYIDAASESQAIAQVDDGQARSPDEAQTEYQVVLYKNKPIQLELFPGGEDATN